MNMKLKMEVCKAKVMLRGRGVGGWLRGVLS